MTILPSYVTPHHSGYDPEYRLVAAIIVRAIRDLDKTNRRVVAEAVAYLHSENFDHDCRVLRYDPDAARHALRPYLEKHREQLHLRNN